MLATQTLGTTKAEPSASRGGSGLTGLALLSPAPGSEAGTAGRTARPPQVQDQHKTRDGRSRVIKPPV